MWRTSRDNRIDRLVVFTHRPGEGAVPLGQLQFEGGGKVRAGRFAYARSWLARDDRRDVDPIGLPLSKKSYAGAPHEVPLAFYDVGPDGWGKQILTAAFPSIQLGMGEFLALGGDARTGDLLFGPTPDGTATWAPVPPLGETLQGEDDLERLVAAAAAFEDGTAGPGDYAVLFDSAADVGGARPKARFKGDGRSWIAKFPTAGDPFDDPRAEAVCLDLAELSGLEVPARRLLTVRNRTVLLVERFDRDGDGRRHSYLSAGTLLRESPTSYITSKTYLDVAVTAGNIGVPGPRHEMYRRLLVNAFVHNTDDHLRNTAVIRVEGAWRFSPVFDVVPHRQARHALAPAPGLSPQHDVAAAIGCYRSFGLTREQAGAIIDQVVSAMATLPDRLSAREVGARDRSTLGPLMAACLNPPAMGSA